MGRDDSKISLENLNKQDNLKRNHEENMLYALRFYNLLISLIQKEAVLRQQALMKSNQDDAARKELARYINHALTLLAAARETIKKDGPSPVTDYLHASALSHLAKCLPAAAIKNIISKLDAIEKHDSKRHQQHERKTRINHPESTNKPATTQNVDGLQSRLNQAIAPLTQKKASSQTNFRKQIVIDFAADKQVMKVYGQKRAHRLGASLIQVQPNQFSATNESFEIAQNTTLTFIGHCSKGSSYLSDNHGRKITAAQIAKQIHAKLTQTGAALDTEFTIDLIACQAASASKRHPSFAQRLANELFHLGITNASVIASPTIMMTTHDGSQNNMSLEEDRRFTRRMRGKEQHDVGGVFNGIGSSVNSFFNNKTSEGLSTAKVTFRSNHAHQETVSARTGLRR